MTDKTYGEAITDLGDAFGSRYVRIAGSGAATGQLVVTESRRGIEQTIAVPLNLAQIDEQIAALVALRKDIIEHGNSNPGSSVIYRTADDIAAWRAERNVDDVVDTPASSLQVGFGATIQTAKGPRYGTIDRLTRIADSIHIELHSGIAASVNADALVPAIRC